MALILGIESSCDETAAAVVEDGVVVHCNVVASQNDLHAEYGGVVPEIASRAHLERLLPVLRAALHEANVKLDDLGAIAVGNRPGLVGSLLTGVSAAKALAWALDKPLIGIDHVHAHLHAAALVQPKIENRKSKIRFPALGLVVSGGHTALYAMASPLELTRLGRTIDDAVGEAYDKAAIILGLGYPGGPKLDALAREGDPARFDLPRSLLERDSLDFSFSGLKTALLYAVRGHPVGRGKEATFTRSAADLSAADQHDLAAAFQQAAIDAVMVKLERALDQMGDQGNGPTCVILGGGVSANSRLRERAAALGEKRGLPVYVPAMAYCVDNAAMIAGLAFHLLEQGKCDDLHLPVVATSRL
jgi:N6-L-threonylcarbamoyladenine synthase